MIAAGLGDPCKPEGDSGIKDRRTTAMKALFESCYDTAPNEPFTKAQIYNAIIDGQKHEDDRLAWFGDLNGVDSIKRKMAVGNALSDFDGRELSGIKMVIDKSSSKSQRHQVIFKKED
jgi:hypothetical protein